MKKTYERPIVLRAVKALVRVTLSDSFRIRPRTEVSSLLIVQPAAKIQSPEPRVGYRYSCTAYVWSGQRSSTVAPWSLEPPAVGLRRTGSFPAPHRREAAIR